MSVSQAGPNPTRLTQSLPHYSCWEAGLCIIITTVCVERGGLINLCRPETRYSISVLFSYAVIPPSIWSFIDTHTHHEHDVCGISLGKGCNRNQFVNTTVKIVYVLRCTWYWQFLVVRGECGLVRVNNIQCLIGTASRLLPVAILDSNADVDVV